LLFTQVGIKWDLKIFKMAFNDLKGTFMIFIIVPNWFLVLINWNKSNLKVILVLCHMTRLFILAVIVT